MHSPGKRLRVLTWHVHGNYLWYLSHAPHDFVVPFTPERRHPYGGRVGAFPWPDNLREVPVALLRDEPLDCILFQSPQSYLVDQYEVLSSAQRRLPKIYLEHDPPLEHPFAQRHVVDDPNVLVVHVTPWNATMWDSGRSPFRVVEHGVVVPNDARYTGDWARGICAINHLRTRGRRMGADIYCQARAQVPIDLVGMDAESLGGLGEISPPELAHVQARYRFAFSPIRQTSLGLAILEAMMVGVPVVGLATCELAAVIRNGDSGFLDTSLPRVVDVARQLLADPAEARRMGDGARRVARERFAIDRFARDWSNVLNEAVQ